MIIKGKASVRRRSLWRQSGGLWAFVAWGMAMLLASSAVSALTYSYDNTTSGTISFAATPCANPLLRTFAVTDSFTVTSVAVGLNVAHTQRGDVRVTLVAPNASSLQLIAGSNNNDDNFDVLLSTNSEGALNDGLASLRRC